MHTYTHIYTHTYTNTYITRVHHSELLSRELKPVLLWAEHAWFPCIFYSAESVCQCGCAVFCPLTCSLESRRCKSFVPEKEIFRFVEAGLLTVDDVVYTCGCHRTGKIRYNHTREGEYGDRGTIKATLSIRKRYSINRYWDTTSSGRL